MITTHRVIIEQRTLSKKELFHSSLKTTLKQLFFFSYDHLQGAACIRAAPPSAMYIG